MQSQLSLRFLLRFLIQFLSRLKLIWNCKFRYDFCRNRRFLKSKAFRREDPKKLDGDDEDKGSSADETTSGNTRSVIFLVLSVVFLSALFLTNRATFIKVLETDV